MRESGFSKAKVSRLVSNLRERGVVGVEPISGRENRVLLKTGKKEPDEKGENAAAAEKENKP